jgi:DNA-binding protein HU-beta
VIKSEIISEIARKTGINRSDVQLAIEVLFQSIQSTISERGQVHFRGFGSFLLKKRAKKVARNISQNTAIVIEEHYIPSFKPSKSFVDKIKAKVKDSI